MKKIGNVISRSLLTLAVAGLGLALTPQAAAAGEVFTVDPAAYSGQPQFDADIIHGGYNEVLTVLSFDGTSGTFATVAYWDAGAFGLGSDESIFGTGLGSDYAMYALFSASGSFTANGQGGYEFTADPNSGEIELYADDDGDTVNDLPDNGTGGIASLLALRTNAGDDDLLATATLLSGDGDSSDGEAEGNFQLNFNPFELTTEGGAFFIGPVPFYMTAFLQGNFNEFNPDLQNQDITGSANAQFVPEPASLTLLGMGLLGSGLAARRRRKSQAV